MDEIENLLLADPAFLDAGAAGLAASSADIDPTLRFFDQVRNAALEALDRGAPDGEAMSLIVMSASPREDAARIGKANRVADLNLHDPTHWQGKLIFAAAHGTTGWSFPLPYNDVGATFEWLEGQGFGEAPVAIAYFNNRILSCYPEGGMSDDKPINLTLPAAGKIVSMADIFEVLEDVQKNSLLTPMIGPPKFWNDPGEYIPGPEAERTIRWIVAAQLRSTFRPMQVDIEHVCRVGSVDIVITPPARPLDGPAHAAIIELKALKSFTSGKSPVSAYSNSKAVYKGHRQARAYRDTVAAELGIMAAFDLRKNKNEASNDAWPRARERYFAPDDANIDARIFPVYGTTDDAQEAAAQAA